MSPQNNKNSCTYLYRLGIRIIQVYLMAESNCSEKRYGRKESDFREITSTGSDQKGEECGTQYDSLVVERRSQKI